MVATALPKDWSKPFFGTGDGKLSFVKGGYYGKVFRWDLPDSTDPVAVKYYQVLDAAREDDERRQILREVIPPGDPIQLIPEVRPAMGHLRFFKFIEGHDLSRLASDKTILRRQADAFFDRLVQRLILRYGVEHVTPQNYQGERYVTIDSDGRRIAFKIHDSNFMFEESTGRLWLVDPR